MTKLYYIDPNENEIQASDTVLNLSHSLFAAGSEPWGTSLSVALDATLPVSKFSREQKIVTSAMKLRASKSFFQERLSLSLRPFYRQHFNAFKTLDRDDNGRFLVLYKAGIEAGINVEATRDISLSFSPTWTQRGYEQPAYGAQAAEHDYTFTSAVAYAMNTATSFALGYSESNRAEQLGNVNVFLFDEETSQYFVEAIQIF